MGTSADSSDPDRYRSQALRTASLRSLSTLAVDSSNGALLPTHHTATKATPTHPGGLSPLHGRDGSPQRLRELEPGHAAPAGRHGPAHLDDRGGDGSLDATNTTHHSTQGATSLPGPPPASPPLKSEDARAGDPAIDPAAEQENHKLPMPVRMKAGCKRFYQHAKDALFHNWVNVLLIFVPVGIAAEAAGLAPAAVFAVNAIAIIPLAGLLTHATEAVASRLGDTLGALMNVSFGNAVELIIFIIALTKGEIRIVQASLLGSILANLLLILGMAFLLGGLRYREQIYNSTVTQMSACLLSLSVMSLLLPTAFHASFNQNSTAVADSSVLKVSRGTSIILLIVYFMYLLFQLKSHAYMYESTPQAVIDEESHPGVLHDMMNSSSSESSSSSSDSDSDSSGSGSIATTRKRVKRMFRKRRNTSVSTSSNGTGPDKLSAFSSPSTQEREDPLEDPLGNYGSSRRESHLAPAHDDVEADHEDNGTSRNYDWATKRQLSNDGSVAPEPRKRHRKHSRKEKKKEKKRRHRDAEKESEGLEAANDSNGVEASPKVEFAEQVQTIPSQQSSEQPTTNQTSRVAFNARQLSRVRPGISKMLSGTVFVQPAPVAVPPAQPAMTRSPSSSNLRRTNSLPDRLNRGTQAASRSAAGRTDPLPPYQHQRYPIRKVTSELSTGADADGDVEEQPMSRTAACVLLLISTGLVAACAEFMVDAIPAMVGDGNTVSEAFIGLIILPIVGNAAEHVTAVTVAMKNKMDLAIGVAVGSSIQIALFVTPVIVLLGWALDTNMSLYFNLFETVSLFVTAFVVNFLVLDGRSNYLEGALLIAAYVIIAVVSFFYPAADAQSSVGGGSGTG